MSAVIHADRVEPESVFAFVMAGLGVMAFGYTLLCATRGPRHDLTDPQPESLAALADQSRSIRRIRTTQRSNDEIRL
jgi:hypothetical protein